MGPGAEFDLIRRFLGPVDHDREMERPDVRVGPGDDCAIVVGDGIALTVDMAVEGVHFRRAWLRPEELGFRTAVASLSDLAAVAARPIGLLVSLALPVGDEGTFADAVMAGIRGACRDHEAALLGGDLTRSPGPLVLDLVAAGEAREPVLRSGARPGDELWVTGELGGAAAAVAAWLAEAEPGPEARRAFAAPRARTREALWLRDRRVPTAMVDVSDGIAGDAGHIAAASGVRIVIEGAALPVATGTPPGEAVRLAAAGGEDYELCFTAAPGAMRALAGEFQDAFGIRATRVGRVEEGRGCEVVDEAGRAMPVRAFQHWRRA